MQIIQFPDFVGREQARASTLHFDTKSRSLVGSAPGRSGRHRERSAGRRGGCLHQPDAPARVSARPRWRVGLVRTRLFAVPDYPRNRI